MIWGEQIDQIRVSGAASSELDKAFGQCFGTAAGKTVLEYLRKSTIEQPTWFPGEDASHGYAREGQNSLVREIERRIERSHGRGDSS
tara:strand:- start:1352 stop:1612 length:261 start_codon:yes stop_codon:yes gene_type:complete